MARDHLHTPASYPVEDIDDQVLGQKIGIKEESQLHSAVFTEGSPTSELFELVEKPRGKWLAVDLECT